MGGWNILADEIRFDGQLAMSAVNEHRQLDAPGPAEVIQGVHRRPDGAAAKEHIIHQHDRTVTHLFGPGHGKDAANILTPRPYTQANLRHGVANAPQRTGR
jgi:hypothetical protein